MVFNIFTDMYSYHHSQLQNIFIILKRNPIPFTYHSPIPHAPLPQP